VKIVGKAATINSFLEFIEGLKATIGEGRVIIFMDNLPIHHSKRVQELIEVNGWQCIFNAPYSSQYHCIEELFSLVKRKFQKELLTRNF